MIKNQSKLNVSGIGRFFKRLQHKQCGLKKLCIFGFLGKSINQLSKNGEHYRINNEKDVNLIFGVAKWPYVVVSK